MCYTLVFSCILPCNCGSNDVYWTCLFELGMDIVAQFQLFINSSMCCLFSTQISHYTPVIGQNSLMEHAWTFLAVLDCPNFIWDFLLVPLPPSWARHVLIPWTASEGNWKHYNVVCSPRGRQCLYGARQIRCPAVVQCQAPYMVWGRVICGVVGLPVLCVQPQGIPAAFLREAGLSG